MNEMTSFHRELIADVQGDADAMGLITSEAFLEKVGELLDEAGEISAFEQCFYEGTYDKKSIGISAYCWDPGDEEGVLSIIISDFVRSEEPQGLLKPDINALLNKLIHFTKAARDTNFSEKLEETSSAFVFADFFVRNIKKFGKIKLILATNRLNKARSWDAHSLGTIAGIPTTVSIWDLARLERFISSGQTRDDLVVNFADDFGEPISVLKASFDGAPLESYIAVVPGSQLADIYDKWGARLLEANVRSFLQARNKVNRGIRDTIKDDPSMFFSYNNGLTATAESVEVVQMEDGLFLMSAENFQIVNGGQTTASIHAAKKLSPAQLKNVFVQMKLTVVPKASVEEIVPNISLYANSQNKVNAADFSSNQPFHVQMEEFSRRVLAPSGEDEYRETKWFYERARGQYADEYGKRNVSEKRKFKTEFPRNQFITKTDLAKFENSYRCKPHVVSLGAQKNFGNFASAIGKEWKKNESEFDETWFKRLIAKAIIFRTLEKLVPAQDWYEGGYRANIVTYAFAKLVHDAEQQGKVPDLDRVWKLQRVPAALEEALKIAAKAANEQITNPPDGVRNFSEWAKKQACWEQLSRRDLDYPENFGDVLVSPQEAKAAQDSDRKDRNAMSGAEAMTEVMQQGGEYWSQILNFGLHVGKISPKEKGILTVCSQIPNKLPSEKQAVIAIEVANRLEQFY